MLEGLLEAVLGLGDPRDGATGDADGGARDGLHPALGLERVLDPQLVEVERALRDPLVPVAALVRRAREVSSCSLPKLARGEVPIPAATAAGTAAGTTGRTWYTPV